MFEQQSPKTPTASLDTMTWLQKYEFAQQMLVFPALTIMVFMRRKLGYRALKPTMLFSMAFVMIVFANIAGYATTNGLGKAPSPTQKWPLIVYAVAMVVYGLIQRRIRWNELVRGERWYTKSTGISHFSFLPFSHFIIVRYVDAFVSCLIGFLMLPLSLPLGMWWILSGSALGGYEQYTYEKRIDRELDVLDSLFASEVQGKVMEHFSVEQPSEKELALEETAGIPTGLSPDIQKQIARRQKRAPLANNPTHNEGNQMQSTGA